MAQLPGNRNQLSQRQHWRRLSVSAFCLCPWRYSSFTMLSRPGPSWLLTGYVGGTVGLLVIAAVGVHCMHLLVQSKQRLAEGYPFDHLSYSVRKLEGPWQPDSDLTPPSLSLLGCCKSRHGTRRRVPGRYRACNYAGEAVIVCAVQDHVCWLSMAQHGSAQNRFLTLQRFH